MPSTFNKEQVIELTEKLGKAKAIYFTDYLGLDVSSITELRKIFFEQGIEFRVAKNTLIKLAAENNKIEVDPKMATLTFVDILIKQKQIIV